MPSADFCCAASHEGGNFPVRNTGSEGNTLKRVIFALTFFLLLSADRAFADPMFHFTITDDGHTFRFTAPNPPSVTDHPHAVQVELGPAPGTVDGVGGYTFAGPVIVELDFADLPVLMLGVSPSLPGQGGSFPFGPDYYLNGPMFTELVSDVPNPHPECYAFNVCNDIQAFAFVPGDYSLYGFDPARNQASYILNITAASATGVTPEPPSLLLALAGLAGALVPLRRGLSARDGRTTATA